MKSREITPYKETVTDEPLVENLPEPQNIVEEKTIEEVGITEWILSNGVRVVIKPTDFKEDQILFRALSPGGASLSGDEDYIASSTASQVIASGGLGKFNATDLQKKLAAKVVQVSPFIGRYEEDLSGTYGVGVNASTSWRPDQEYSIRINFGTDPKRVEELTGFVFKEIDEMKTSGASEKYLNKVKETQRRLRETNLKQNKYWLNQLVFRYSNIPIFQYSNIPVQSFHPST